jgi:GMP synthase-like glutamine amidotransferase
MKLTLIQIDESPTSIRDRFERYEPQYQRLFASITDQFEYDYVYPLDGEALPDPATLEAIAITGSAFGVYEHPAWIDPMRDFIRAAYDAKTPMLAVCFGHQLMADALGGDVRLSEKGWGVGRQEYQCIAKPDFARDLPDQLAIAASHQDQVITRPDSAKVWLTSDFCPNAGLIYESGTAMSLQPHPEFDLPYSRALLELRRGNPFTDAELDEMQAALDAPLDDRAVGEAMVRFLVERLGAAGIKR